MKDNLECFRSDAEDAYAFFDMEPENASKVSGSSRLVLSAKCDSRCSMWIAKMARFMMVCQGN
jgi:hypothetical protein